MSFYQTYFHHDQDAFAADMLSKVRAEGHKPKLPDMEPRGDGGRNGTRNNNQARVRALMETGMRPKEISDALGMEPKTVYNIVGRLKGRIAVQK